MLANQGHLFLQLPAPTPALPPPARSQHSKAGRHLSFLSGEAKGNMAPLAKFNIVRALLIISRGYLFITAEEKFRIILCPSI